MPNEPEVDVAACRRRQRRLVEVMQQQGIELVIVTQIDHVQWLAGPRFGPLFSPAAAMGADGRVTLVCPLEPAAAAADDVVTYEAKRLSTLRNDQRQASSLVLLSRLEKQIGAERVGLEFSTCGPHITAGLHGKLVDIEPELFRLRRRKEADELARLRQAIAGTGAMYSLARDIIRPGLNELDVFNELQSAATREFGEPPTATGNDYASGERGGPPRDRAIEAGELYILDLGPAYRGYFADNCRTYAVDRRPTAAQLEAWERVCQVFSLVDRLVRPGVRCREVFDAAQAMLDAARPWVFDHHLGHGIGLFPHEAPHLNPNWDDRFEAGDVIAVEPGLYGPDLRAGIRLENNYLVTETGVELLTAFPLDLA